MFFPDALYTLSARDLQLTWLEPVLFSTRVTAAGAFLQDRYEVPTDRMLLLQHVGLRLFPAATETIVVAQSGILLANAGVTTTPPAVRLVMSTGAGTAQQNAAVAVQHWMSWQGSILVPPAWTVEAVGNFSPGAAATDVLELYVIGLLVPPGNVQRL